MPRPQRRLLAWRHVHDIGHGDPDERCRRRRILVPDDTNHDAKFELELLQDVGEPTLTLLSKGVADVTLFVQLS
jgi:hypothetical protein